MKVKRSFNCSKITLTSSSLLSLLLLLQIFAKVKSNQDFALQVLKQRLKQQPFFAFETNLNNKERETPTKRSGAGGFGLPNLFTFRPVSNGAVVKDNCDEAFRLFFDSSFSRVEPKPEQKFVVMRGNASSEEQWEFFFNTGKEGSRGYHGCLQYPQDASDNGVGPCADFMEGSDCHFFPEFAVSVHFYPACCDKRNCRCQCIRQCTTRTQIVTLLEQNVVEHDYFECTNKVRSVEEGERWKEERCDIVRKKNNECDVKCVREGACVRDVCKFCFKWSCTNQTTTSTSISKTSNTAVETTTTANQTTTTLASKSSNTTVKTTTPTTTTTTTISTTTTTARTTTTNTTTTTTTSTTSTATSTSTSTTTTTFSSKASTNTLKTTSSTTTSAKEKDRRKFYNSGYSRSAWKTHVKEDIDEYYGESDSKSDDKREEVEDINDDFYESLLKFDSSQNPSKNESQSNQVNLEIKPLRQLLGKNYLLRRARNASTNLANVSFEDLSKKIAQQFRSLSLV